MRPPGQLAATAFLVLTCSTAGAEVRDLEGRTVLPSSEPVSVLIFTRTDCPVSNRYAPEISRLYERFRSSGVRFRLVYLDGKQTSDAIRSHMREYGYRLEGALDRNHELVRATGATVTPEAAVYAAGSLVYRGRIDDRYAGIGRSRPAPTRRDLEDVLTDIIAGKRLRFHSTRAVGCVIEDLR